MKKEHEEELRLQAVMEEYADDFNKPITAGQKFITGSTYLSEDGKTRQAAAGGQAYVPAHIPANYANPDVQPVARKPLPKKSGKMMDSFLEELKARNAARDAGSLPSQKNRSPARDERDRKPAAAAHVSMFGSTADYSFESDDPSSTNLYVGNLAPGVTEEILVREFGKHGAIASVKIMWPHTEEERVRQRNSGFVCYMVREDAAKGLEATHNMDLLGYELCVGWGKSIPRPLTPLYVPPNSTSFKLDPKLPRVTVPDLHSKTLLVKLASCTARHGVQFEQVIRAREEKNTDFAFLRTEFGPDNPQQVFYKWKVYSLLQGDTIDQWRTAPFQMYLSGPVWIPPAIPTVSATKPTTPTPFAKKPSAAPSLLSNEDSETFFQLLRVCTTTSQAVKGVMVFAMDHAYAAADLVEFITQSLTLDETPVDAKLARLYVVNDVLFNSGSTKIKGGQAFRRSLETNLPSIFKSFNHLLRQQGRLTSKKFEEDVLTVVQVWEKWSVFPPDVLQAVRALFINGK